MSGPGAGGAALSLLEAPSPARPRRTPVDVDPEFVARDASPRAFLMTIGATTTLALLAVSPPGRAWLGLEPWPLLTLTALHAAAFVVNVWWLGPQGFVRPSLWPWRLFGYGLTFALSASYAAGSQLSVSPAYAMAFAGMPHFARVVPGSKALAALLAGIPLLLRLLLVPQCGLPSLASALLVGVAVAATYLLGSRRAGARLRLARQLAAERALGDEALARTAQLRVAMSLHDGLTGTLCGVRHRLAAGSGAQEVQPLLAHLLLRARLVVGAAPVGSLAELADQLRATLAALQLPGRIELAAAPRQLPPEELLDLQAVACEALANAHQSQATSLTIRLEGARRRTTLVAQSTEPDAAPRLPGGGRGLRNIALRAESRGGQAQAHGVDGGWRVEAQWPAGSAQRLLAPRWPDLALEPALVALFAVGLWWVEPAPPGTLLVLAVGLAVTVLLQRGAVLIQRARHDCAEARRRRWEAERSGALLRVRQALTPLLDQLAADLAARRLEAIPPLLDTLATRLGEVLASLESTVSASCRRDSRG